jgi:hypothetical protein
MNRVVEAIRKRKICAESFERLGRCYEYMDQIMSH